MKNILCLLVFVILTAACKKNESPDPFAGTYLIGFTVGSINLSLINNAGNLGIGSSSEKWIIESAGNGKYTLTPFTDQSRIMTSDDSAGYLITRPATLSSKELFTFEKNPSNKNMVNIKSVESFTYFVFQGGLYTNGNICCWALTFDNKTPCNSDFSGLGANSSICQYDFLLTKQ